MDAASRNLFHSGSARRKTTHITDDDSDVIQLNYQDSPPRKEPFRFSILKSSDSQVQAPNLRAAIQLMTEYAPHRNPTDSKYFVRSTAFRPGQRGKPRLGKTATRPAVTTKTPHREISATVGVVNTAKDIGNGDHTTQGLENGAEPCFPGLGASEVVANEEVVSHEYLPDSPRSSQDDEEVNVCDSSDNEPVSQSSHNGGMVDGTRKPTAVDAARRRRAHPLTPYISRILTDAGYASSSRYLVDLFRVIVDGEPREKVVVNGGETLAGLLNRARLQLPAGTFPVELEKIMDEECEVMYAMEEVFGSSAHHQRETYFAALSILRGSTTLPSARATFPRLDITTLTFVVVRSCMQLHKPIPSLEWVRDLARVAAGAADDVILENLAGYCGAGNHKKKPSERSQPLWLYSLVFAPYASPLDKCLVVTVDQFAAQHQLSVQYRDVIHEVIKRVIRTDCPISLSKSVSMSANVKLSTAVEVLHRMITVLDAEKSVRGRDLTKEEEEQFNRFDDIIKMIETPSELLKEQREFDLALRTTNKKRSLSAKLRDPANRSTRPKLQRFPWNDWMAEVRRIHAEVDGSLRGG